MKRTVSLIFLLLSLVACDFFNPPVRTTERPSVTATSPENGDNVVSPNTEIVAELELPNGPIDEDTLGNGTVKLTKAGEEPLLSGDISFLDDKIVFAPRNTLDVNVLYAFEITDGVQDEDGVSVEPYRMTFETSDRPRIARSEPRNLDTGVNPEASVSLYPANTDGGLDDATSTAATVKLTEVATGASIDVVRGTSGGFDIITLNPREPLKENTEYRVETTDGLQDQAGNAFIPFSSTFTTGDKDPNTPGNVNFDRVSVTPSGDNDSYTSLAIGPDRKLYATTVDGRIKRFPINADGTLGDAEVISSLQSAEGGPRLLIGFAFDPSATADNLIAWVSHTFVDENFTLKNIDEPWSGKITRLSGPSLETVQDYVVGLPRSSKDHVTNSIAFNPAEPDALYFNQGSNSAMGAPDSAWNYREEQLLTAATLRLDISAVSSPPLDVQTEDGGNYDPFASGAPLTIFGSGIRNAYDLVWHSNGSLYVPTNGSNLGGIVPRYDLSGLDSSVCNGYSGPVLDSPDDVDGLYETDRTDGWLVEKQVQSDFLFRVEEGGYYGHPNPKRCEWILNGGGNYRDSAAQVDIYKSDTDPDPDYRGFAYDFEKNKSPNGVIEYKSDTFGGELQGKLLVARYSNEDDILVLVPGNDGDIDRAETPDDLDNLSDPIDLVEDTTNGNLYISEFDESKSTDDQGIVLLRPVE